ncbi:hypothetical protein [Neobacillus sp. D3-1R]|uniref:hypothetical protein n=1 Tax=Neobacillus sp. D3-1R TaxID=3445778 RepID=UPI003F9F7F6D
MKFYIPSFLLSTIFILMVSGCGTTSQDDLTQTNGAKNKVTLKDSSTSQSGQSTNDVSEEHIRILEQNLVYQKNGQEEKDTAFLKYSDNQNYSIYVLPDFELAAEEPYKDILYVSKNDSIFMRIELLPDDVDWNLVKEETSSQLKAVSQTIKTQTPVDDEFFKDTIILEAANEEDIVTSYLVNNEDLQMKLTIFNKKQEDYRDALLQMAKTIMKETNKNAG